jgi:hypothetical protein
MNSGRAQEVGDKHFKIRKHHYYHMTQSFKFFYFDSVICYIHILVFYKQIINGEIPTRPTKKQNA